MPSQTRRLLLWLTTLHRTQDREPSIRAAITTAFPRHQGDRNMEVFVGMNRNAPGVFRVVVPMTDHRWRGFCECGAPTDDLCRLDEERMDAVVVRFRAWAYVRVIEV